ncbi:hypothetical protein SH668x_001274 [Planctomicrobium sp. SH668]|uniref:hypothetical protein n=1 Tax=Planctomicrobium sp. SH668 TaxID=3448126 RepID=UPI003F5B5E82
MPGFIADGYTVEGYVKELPGRHEAVNFTYRPATREELIIWRENRDGTSGETVAQIDADLLAKHIVKWDLKYPSGSQKGQVVPSTAQNCKRLEPNLARLVLDIIAGAEPSNSKPDGPESFSPERELKN